jgi:hypothetical protein
MRNLSLYVCNKRKKKNRLYLDRKTYQYTRTLDINMLQRLIENTPNDVYYHDKSSDKKEVRICTENNRCNYYLNGITYKYESTCINEN